MGTTNNIISSRLFGIARYTSCALYRGPLILLKTYIMYSMRLHLSAVTYSYFFSRLSAYIMSENQVCSHSLRHHITRENAGSCGIAPTSTEINISRLL